MKPSISKLLDLLNKPALMKWANKIGLQGIELDKYRAQMQGDGTSLHKQIENWLKYKTPFENSSFQKRCEDFFSEKEVLSLEEKIENDMFTGRLDIVYKHNGLVYLCDFKTNHTKLWLENKLQLTAYRMSKTCDKVAIIGIPEFNVIEANIEDFKPYEMILKALSDIYNLKTLLHEF
jgi:hypothetical protein